MISANYFDGLSARLHPVDLELGHGTHWRWPGADDRQVLPVSRRHAWPNRSPAPLRCSTLPTARRCEIGDPAAKAAIAARARLPQVARWCAGRNTGTARCWRWCSWLAPCWPAIKWGVPALADRVVASLPASVDKQVGDAALDALNATAGSSRAGFSDERHRARSSRSSSRSRRQDRRMPLRVVGPEFGHAAAQRAGVAERHRSLSPTAWSCTSWASRPISTTHARAMLAGVLAHEIGHIEGRHSMRALARAFAAAAVVGDAVRRLQRGGGRRAGAGAQHELFARDGNARRRLCDRAPDRTAACSPARWPTCSIRSKQARRAKAHCHAGCSRQATI